MASFKKILLIDDDVITVSICERMMKYKNFAEQIVACSDGSEAKDYLTKNSTNMPEIILLDLHMGVMDGWEFLEWLQNSIQNFPLCPPVYVLSSSLSREDSERAEAYSLVKGYIIKPILMEHLTEMSLKHSANLT